MISLNAALLALGACSTELTHGGSAIQIVKQEQMKQCRQLRQISVSLPLGGSQDAQREAMNQAAGAGGDSLYIYFNWADAFRGAQVQGVALQCNFAAAGG